MSEAFELFDKERRGSLSREDFRDVFKNMKLRIEEGDIEKFIDHFWKDQKAGIDYQAFLRIFNKYQVRLEDDEKNMRRGPVKIPEEVIRLKKRIFTQINDSMLKYKKSFKEFFYNIDIDESNQIDIQEFMGLFQKMKLELNEVEI